MEVAANHPGRQAFCLTYAGDAKADPVSCCLGDAPWYLNGRPYGNSGPECRLRRESRTARLAASVDDDLLMAGRDANWDVGLSYSWARGNLKLPAVDTDRAFRASRGFGGPDCGVGVTADRTSRAGMALGAARRRRAGPGPLHVLQPVQQRHSKRSDQPGIPFRSTPNPDYVPAWRTPRRCGSGSTRK